MPSEEFKVLVGVELDKSSLTELKNTIKNSDIKPLEIDIKLKQLMNT